MGTQISLRNFPRRAAWIRSMTPLLVGPVGVGVICVALALIAPPSLGWLDTILFVVALVSLATASANARRLRHKHDLMSQALALSDARYFNVVESAADGVIVLDADGIVRFANATVERLFNLSRERIIGESISMLVPSNEDIPEADHLDALLRQSSVGEPLHGQIASRFLSARRSDGSKFPIGLSISRLYTDGELTYTVIIHDERDRKLFEDQLAYQATHDSLTDLPNRSLFHDRLQTALERMARDGGGVGVLLIDLDRFKAINDTLGHDVGDMVLQETARRLRSAVRRSDTVARLGGDEFAVLCEPAESMTSAVTAARRILRALELPFPNIPVGLSPTASIGVSVVTSSDTKPHDLVREADSALYRAKRDGRGCFRLVEGATTGPDLRPNHGSIDLRERLDAGALIVAYQPVLDAQTGEIVAVEALARVRAADGSTVPPSAFIHRAERNGLIDRLGEDVLRIACRDIAQLRLDGFGGLRVSVNVSPHQLGDPRFSAVVARALSNASLPPEALTLEITESAAVSSVPRAALVVESIADTGVQIALDDFGTGNSSLDLLRSLPASELKIDRSFVSGVTRSGLERDIVGTLIDLAVRREMRVVAEGVETIDQADTLTRLGCGYLQGFLYSEPVEIELLRAALAQGLSALASPEPLSPMTSASESLAVATASASELRRPNRSAQS